MPNLKLTIAEDKDTITINGIPEDVWEKFKVGAKTIFKDDDNAWAKYLGAVISLGGENTTYLMTGVPLEFANKLAAILKRISWSWDQFHTYLLHSAKRDNLRVIRFGTNEHNGTFIAAGIDPVTFLKIEELTGKPIEIVLATVLIAIVNGSIQFSPDTQWLSNE